MRTIRFSLSLVAVTLGVGCFAEDDTSINGAAATTDDIAGYEQLSLEVQDGARTYRQVMMTLATGAAAECRRIHDQYDAQVRPLVSQAVHLAGAMDRYMDEHGGADAADYSCVSTAMMSELDRHHAAACVRSDLAGNQAEADRHAAAMLSYGGQLSARCDQMMRGIESGHWDWEPMMRACNSWDGCCSDMMHAGRGDGSAGMMGSAACCDW